MNRRPHVCRPGQARRLPDRGRAGSHGPASGHLASHRRATRIRRQGSHRSTRRAGPVSRPGSAMTPLASAAAPAAAAPRTAEPSRAAPSQVAPSPAEPRTASLKQAARRARTGPAGRRAWYQGSGAYGRLSRVTGAVRFPTRASCRSRARPASPASSTASANLPSTSTPGLATAPLRPPGGRQACRLSPRTERPARAWSGQAP